MYEYDSYVHVMHDMYIEGIRGRHSPYLNLLWIEQVYSAITLVIDGQHYELVHVVSNNEILSIQYEQINGGLVCYQYPVVTSKLIFSTCNFS